MGFGETISIQVLLVLLGSVVTFYKTKQDVSAKLEELKVNENWKEKREKYTILTDLMDNIDDKMRIYIRIYQGLEQFENGVFDLLTGEINEAIDSFQKINRKKILYFSERTCRLLERYNTEIFDNSKNMNALDRPKMTPQENLQFSMRCFEVHMKAHENYYPEILKEMKKDLDWDSNLNKTI